MTPTRIVLSALALSALAACAASDGARAPQVSRQSEPLAPAGAPPGTCWGRHVSPAVIETVTEQVMVRPADVAEDGTVTRPASYRTDTVQRIVRERRETWFETPCDDVMTPELIASLQRALAARGHYRGAVTGRMDTRTQAAVRHYQKSLGLDSGTLSLAAARKLGLVAVEIPKG